MRLLSMCGSIAYVATDNSKAAFTLTRVRVRVPVYTGYMVNTVFVYIPIAAVHINTGSVYVYELF